MMQSWRISKIDPGNVTIPASGTIVRAELPDGPGYYELLRFSARRISGVAGTNWRLAVYDSDGTTTGTVSVENEIWRETAATAIATGILYPVRTQEGIPGRYGYSPDGFWHVDFGVDVAGDVARFAMMVLRLR